jgi:hypothetical protein
MKSALKAVGTSGLTPAVSAVGQKQPRAVQQTGADSIIRS